MLVRIEDDHCACCTDATSERYIGHSGASYLYRFKVSLTSRMTADSCLR